MSLRRPGAVLVEQAHDRLGEHGAERRGGDAAGTRSAACRWPPRAGSRAGRRPRRGARASGRAPPRPRPRTCPAGACRCGTRPRRRARRRCRRRSPIANTVAMNRLRLISPSPSVIGSICVNTRRRAGSPTSQLIVSRPPRPRSHGSGSRNCTSGRQPASPTRRARPGSSGSSEPKPTSRNPMITRFQTTGTSAGTVNSPNAHQDRVDEPGQAEQQHDREEDADERDGEVDARLLQRQQVDDRLGEVDAERRDRRSGRRWRR